MRNNNFGKIDFFIAGAPKSGTSSLYDILSSHPHVVAPKIKETHYFSRSEAERSYYNVEIIKSEKEMEGMYPPFLRVDGLPLVGDFSPSYLASETALRQIANYNRESKLIFILRDPVERAISHYLMDVSLGYARADQSIEYYIENSDKHKYQYIECGKYKRGLQLALELFKSNVLVLGYENFLSDPDESISKIVGFLNLDKNYPLYTNTHSNPALIDKFGFYGIYSRSLLLKRVGKLIPGGIRRFVRGGITKKGKLNLYFHRENLAKYFEEDISYMKDNYEHIVSGWRGRGS